ncbi:hypothetical protein F5050DRAFT_1709887 [Lentinula boryana]|uniref:Alpha-type protein kinase domain-containing protein n=1 Tax=Lentinula boryana TaxID=40481 RepID=A0ABQ8QLM3_9AGAR|nr:hypothetical protein F5050DRAFT_1709887 [Lentinula boryana]
MFLRKPSSLYRPLLVHLSLAIALFSLMVVASPVGITHLLNRDQELERFVIQLGRKQTGSDAWLPSSVNFAKDQHLTLFIGNHLLEFQGSTDPHTIIHQNPNLPTNRNCLILLGEKRRRHLSFTIGSDKTAAFWAKMTDIMDLERELGRKIYDDLDYNYAVMSALIHGDPEWRIHLLVGPSKISVGLFKCYWSGAMEHPLHNNKIGDTLTTFAHFTYQWTYKSLVFADLRSTEDITNLYILFDPMTHTIGSILIRVACPKVEAVGSEGSGPKQDE